MWMRAADEMGKAHAHELDVVDVAAFAGDEPLVFLAHDAGANTFNTHADLPPGGLVGRRFHRSAFPNEAMPALFCRLRDLHPARGIQYRLDDVVVAGAAADVAFELVAHG